MQLQFNEEAESLVGFELKFIKRFNKLLENGGFALGFHIEEISQKTKLRRMKVNIFIINGESVSKLLEPNHEFKD